MPATSSIKPQEQVALSWGEVDWMVELAVKTMLEMDYIPSRIIPIGGGGLIPAALIAYRFYKKRHLPLTLLPPVYAKSYTPDHQQSQLSLVWPFDDPKQFDSELTLLVDDICDTGRTLWAINEQLPQSAIFTLVTKIKTLSFPSGHPLFRFSKYDNKNCWWIFPWEKETPAKD